MRKRDGALAVALMLSAGTAFADMTMADCEAVRAAIPALLDGTGVLESAVVADIAVEGGACVFRGVMLATTAFGTNGEISADRITLALDDVQALLAGTRPPHAIFLDVDNFRARPRALDFKQLDFALRAQGYWHNMDVSFAVRWNEAEQRVIIDRLLFDAPGNNGFAFSAEIEGIDLSSFGALQTSLGGMALTRLSGQIESEGMFEYALVLLLGALFPNDADMDLAMGEFVAAVQAGIEAAPADILSDAGKTALIAVVDDFPNPGGTLGLEIVADPGIGMLRAVPFFLNGLPRAPEDVWSVLGGVTIDARYDRVRVE